MPEQIKGLKGQPVLGDPGLLASSLVKKPALKTIRVGIIPHINHRNSPEIASLLSLIPGSRVIDVFSPVKQVLEEIASCEFVLSTSLHGLIVADSYGVPNQWLCMKRYPQWEFKFRDYYSSFGIADPVPVTPEQIHRIHRAQHRGLRPPKSLQEGLQGLLACHGGKGLMLFSPFRIACEHHREPAVRTFAADGVADLVAQGIPLGDGPAAMVAGTMK